ncbi:protein kinase [Trypanosoma rangeli]|uniref:Protein kinase n=1 Tax=Trypanosoma rangeli TaxID=5698 RepID=A0A3R7P0K7_TRYRA|nr:protein kinase [Trypanosoma rangeli]RNF10766.1 protein kinase [Trypanosoma rangeli]|eukprot:RNF10766.1 protein kinase [Trypanosoma rangeli]
MVVHCSLVLKEASGFLKRMSRKRILFLTDLPRLFYVELSTRAVKGTIPITAHLYAEAVTAESFRVVTRERSYVFRDLSKCASRWAVHVNEMVNRLYPVGSHVDVATVSGSGGGKLHCGGASQAMFDRGSSNGKGVGCRSNVW